MSTSQISTKASQRRARQKTPLPNNLPQHGLDDLGAASLLLRNGIKPALLNEVERERKQAKQSHDPVRDKPAIIGAKKEIPLDEAFYAPLEGSLRNDFGYLPRPAEEVAVPDSLLRRAQRERSMTMTGEEREGSPTASLSHYHTSSVPTATMGKDKMFTIPYFDSADVSSISPPPPLEDEGETHVLGTSGITPLTHGEVGALSHSEGVEAAKGRGKDSGSDGVITVGAAMSLFPSLMDGLSQQAKGSSSEGEGGEEGEKRGGTEEEGRRKVETTTSTHPLLSYLSEVAEWERKLASPWEVMDMPLLSREMQQKFDTRLLFQRNPTVQRAAKAWWMGVGRSEADDRREDVVQALAVLIRRFTPLCSMESARALAEEEYSTLEHIMHSALIEKEVLKLETAITPDSVLEIAGCIQCVQLCHTLVASNSAQSYSDLLSLLHSSQYEADDSMKRVLPNQIPPSAPAELLSQRGIPLSFAAVTTEEEGRVLSSLDGDELKGRIHRMCDYESLIRAELHHHLVYSTAKEGRSAALPQGDLTLHERTDFLASFLANVQRERIRLLHIWGLCAAAEGGSGGEDGEEGRDNERNIEGLTQYISRRSKLD
eukprot:CAMPEP_0113867774 /NCGR_PEP_ID=MMETSP0780_2-20120614/611_1 /TAXON_ID=652834 /ORGANISM="Palpitomonas bilix" /LENGTH=599 /DNA_ID=CAMNT_0000852765 /DNA_START=265 /DNA_END=2061 /DNA_ORIENTATION=- /assembly_acc=CAM_ASM_000599